MMKFLHILSIVIEFITMNLGLAIARKKRKLYGWLIAFTFAIYVLYDISMFMAFTFMQPILYFLFFIASLSILWAMWLIYKN